MSSLQKAKDYVEILFKDKLSSEKFYHNFIHTTYTVNKAEEIMRNTPVSGDDQEKVLLALWFHDVVYLPKAHDNEEQSAVLAQKRLSQTGLDTDEIERIAKYILATKAHQNIVGDTDLDFLLDIDLAILASPKLRFEEYEQQIRQEYSWVAEDIYQQKRQQVLQGFYQQQRLYQTDYFYQRLESRAKGNLRE